MEDNDKSSIESRYKEGEKCRRNWLERARDYAAISIPSLMPKQGFTGSSKLPVPNQSLAARGLRNLASKMLLALFPPNASFFRLTLSDMDIEKLFKQQGLKAEVEQAMAKIERSISNYIEASNTRVSLYEAFLQLLCAGNCLLYFPESGGIKMFTLEHYVVWRDPDGKPLEMIVHERINKDLLSPELRKHLSLDKTKRLDKDNDKDEDDLVCVYTQIKRMSQDRWEIVQEINKTTVPGSQGHYPTDKLPWLPLQFIPISGQNYGRSLVEELFGDLKAYDALSKAITKGSAVMSKIIFLLNPNGMTKARNITTAETGDFVSGNAADVTTVQADKHMDFGVVQRHMEVLREQLSSSFLMNSSVQRNGERVTATEIRYVAQELEDALGGVYSVLTQELQLPMVNIVMARLTKQGKLPAMPKDSLKPTITTGLEALGRGQDAQRLKGFLEDASILGPETLKEFIKEDKYLNLMAASWSISAPDIIRSEQEVMQQRQQAQMQAAMQSMAPQVANNLTPDVKAQDLMPQQQPTQ